jgi:hypothetical protein
MMVTVGTLVSIAAILAVAFENTAAAFVLGALAFFLISHA